MRRRRENEAACRPLTNMASTAPPTEATPTGTAERNRMLEDYFGDTTPILTGALKGAAGHSIDQDTFLSTLQDFCSRMKRFRDDVVLRGLISEIPSVRDTITALSKQLSLIVEAARKLGNPKIDGLVMDMQRMLLEALADVSVLDRDALYYAATDVPARLKRLTESFEEVREDVNRALKNARSQVGVAE